MASISTKVAPRRWQFGLRSLLVAVTFAGALCALMVWYHRTVYEPHRCHVSVWAMLISLENRRPATLTPRQWKIATDWTAHNLPANTMAYKDVGKLQQFERDLEAKLKGQVGLDTILWIWDRFPDFTLSGKRYNEVFRDVMIREIERAKNTTTNTAGSTP